MTADQTAGLKITALLFVTLFVFLPGCGGGGGGGGSIVADATEAPVRAPNTRVEASGHPRCVKLSFDFAPNVHHLRIWENYDGSGNFTIKAGEESFVDSSRLWEISLLDFDYSNSDFKLEACNRDNSQTILSPVFQVSFMLRHDITGYFKASNPDNGDSFGECLAISGDGTTMVVTAAYEDSNASTINGDDSNDSASDSGAAYVFVRNGLVWTQQAYLKASNSHGSDFFGKSVAISYDGNTIAVGAPFEDSSSTVVNSGENDDSSVDRGAAYVFTRSGANWTQEAYIKCAPTGNCFYFGSAVGLSNDGNTLVVGAEYNDVGTITAGGAFVFTRTAGNWTPQASLSASNAGQSDYFGKHLALSGDGNTLVVCAEGEDGSSPGVNGTDNDSLSYAGAAYVFNRSGATWNEVAYLKASNPGSIDTFGASVAINNDGTVIAVGASQEDSDADVIDGSQTDGASNAGAVYVFRYSGTWTQDAYIKASNSDAEDMFGTSVSLSDDGNSLAVGAKGEASASTFVNGTQTSNSLQNAGAAYLFRYSEGAWAQSHYVKAPNTELWDFFGTSVSLTADGSVLAVGATAEDGSYAGIMGDISDNGTGESGAVFLY